MGNNTQHTTQQQHNRNNYNTTTTTTTTTTQQHHNNNNNNNTHNNNTMVWQNLVLAKTWFGQTWSWPNLVWPNLVCGQTWSGQTWIWPNLVWPNLDLAKLGLAKLGHSPFFVRCALTCATSTKMPLFTNSCDSSHIFIHKSASPAPALIPSFS